MSATLGVLLDLDGTLIDSRRDLAASVNAALSLRELGPLALDEVVACIGFGARELVRRSLRLAGGADTALDATLADFYAHYRDHCTEETTIYPGVVDGLARLREQGRRLAVVTNKPESFTRTLLDHLDLARFFSVVLGGDSLAARKPDPLPLLTALERLAVSREEAVMVGDSETDVESARRAELRFVGVSYGFRDRAFLFGIGAALVIDRFGELPSLLDFDACEKTPTK